MSSGQPLNYREVNFMGYHPPHQRRSNAYRACSPLSITISVLVTLEEFEANISGEVIAVNSSRFKSSPCTPKLVPKDSSQILSELVSSQMLFDPYELDAGMVQISF
jgi:hypothetical protein